AGKPAPAVSASWPRKAPVVRLKALIRPSPKLPTSSAWLNGPKSSGATAMPQGELSVPCDRLGSLLRAHVRLLIAISMGWLPSSRANPRVGLGSTPLTTGNSCCFLPRRRLTSNHAVHPRLIPELGEMLIEGPFDGSIDSDIIFAPHGVDELRFQFDAIA